MPSVLRSIASYYSQRENGQDHQRAKSENFGKENTGYLSEANLRTDNQNPSGEKVAFQGIKTLTLLSPNLQFRLGLPKSTLGQRYRTNNTFVTSSGLLRMSSVNLGPNHVLSLYLFLLTKQINKIFSCTGDIVPWLRMPEALVPNQNFFLSTYMLSYRHT